MKFSDIQIADRELWASAKRAWDRGNYSAALAILANAQLVDKTTTATVLNGLTNRIVDIEKKYIPPNERDIIRVLRDPPTNLPVGKVYFDWTNPPPYLWREVDALNYTFKNVDDLGLTYVEADEGGW